jgi:hypothetical protein
MIKCRQNLSGHSWWKEQFCSGSDETAINIVMTELDALRPMYVPYARTLTEHLYRYLLSASSRVTLSYGSTSSISIRKKLISLPVVWDIYSFALQGGPATRAWATEQSIQVNEKQGIVTVKAGVPQRVLLDHLAGYR